MKHSVNLFQLNCMSDIDIMGVDGFVFHSFRYFFS